MPVEEPRAAHRILAVSHDGERFARVADGMLGEEQLWPSAFDPTGRAWFTTSGELSL